MSPQTGALAGKLASLYGQDYALWLDNTCQLLRAGRLAEVDIANLLEELTDMGRSEKRALTNSLIVVLMHLLKYAYQPGQRSNSWRFTLKEHRRRLQELLSTSPSLTTYFDQIFADCYQEARDLTATETGVGLENFPVDSPFTQEQVRDRKYLPQ
ncbi:DUF29 domain-containing protein [Leptolyngbya sp. CCNP1308]|uniref:DUF29 domain-containing protein n=1 Tax=Leptolyngbya sp. CCNP1308 TaxID=3110255 RepID=UPI002B21197A|nr:DUF29 domain-containing protein [Leptolyngbya sp. CCNP1308]MEA5447292.1 DUF29 domain-containing protein [Leptolyngbya sp. CCNP1308]